LDKREKLQEINDFVHIEDHGDYETAEIDLEDFNWLIRTIEQQQQEIEKLKWHNQNLMNNGSYEYIDELEKKLQQVNEKIQRYEKALRFYAEEKHYDMIQVNAVYEEVVLDRGEVAKKALEGSE
jgi:uncharacterized protein YecA (UPF0149 family)